MPLVYTVLCSCALVLTNITNIWQGYFTDVGTTMWLPQCQWSRIGVNVLHDHKRSKAQVNCVHISLMGYTVWVCLFLIYMVQAKSWNGKKDYQPKYLTGDNSKRTLKVAQYSSIGSSCSTIILRVILQHKQISVQPIHLPWHWLCRINRSLHAMRKDFKYLPHYRCHNECNGISNHQCLDCLLNNSFRHRSKKTSKLHTTGLCERNPPVTSGFRSQRASNTKNVSIWWRHHVISVSRNYKKNSFCFLEQIPHTAHRKAHSGTCPGQFPHNPQGHQKPGVIPQLTVIH